MATNYQELEQEIRDAKSFVSASQATATALKSSLATTSASVAESLVTSEASILSAYSSENVARDAVKNKFIAYKETSVFAATLLDNIFAEAGVLIDTLAGKVADSLVGRYRLHEQRNKQVKTLSRLARATYIVDLYAKLLEQYDRLLSAMSEHSSMVGSEFANKLSEEVIKSDNLIVAWNDTKKNEYDSATLVYKSGMVAYVLGLRKDTFYWPRPTDERVRSREDNIANLHNAQKTYAPACGLLNYKRFPYKRFVDGETVTFTPIFTKQKALPDAVPPVLEKDWGICVRTVTPYINPLESTLESEAKYIFNIKYDGYLDAFSITSWDDIGIPATDSEPAQYPKLTYSRHVPRAMVSYSKAPFSKVGQAFSIQKTGIPIPETVLPADINAPVYGEYTNDIVLSYMQQSMLEEVPNPPTNVVGTVVGSGQVSVAFTPPAVNVGGRIPVGYKVISYPEGIEATGLRSPVLVRELPNGKTYVFRVMTDNNRWYSRASDPSEPVLLLSTQTDESKALEDNKSKLDVFRATRSTELARRAAL